MDTSKTYEGTLAVRGKGIGFVNINEAEEDIFVGSDDLGFGLNGDRVEIALVPESNGPRQAGKVLRVVQKAREEIIGIVKRHDDSSDQYYLQPDNHRIHVRPTLPEATANDVDMKVAAVISFWNDPQATPEAQITDTLGPAGNHETEMQAIIRSGGIAYDFPEPVQTAADKLSEQREEIFAAAKQDPERRDLREVTTFTIDPDDAKDFDDALSLRSLDSGNLEVGIHIADVSHYVESDGVIDDEAKDRATSVYLVDRVIPMLPEVLSNDLCSLRPDEDRLAFSAVFELSPDGKVQTHWFGQTIIRSDKRFSYEAAQAVLDASEGDYVSELQSLMSLSRQLRKERYQAGAIAFEQPEVKFELDEDGKPVRAYTKERTETMMMIEDFMLLANRQVAKYIEELSDERSRDHAFIYRIHDKPDEEKIEELSGFLHALGYEFEVKDGQVKAKAINELLEAISGTPEENLIKTATIRSMSKAVYATRNIGHFGLAFDYYTHFTSPIRRYPDLLVHRMLRRHLDNRPFTATEKTQLERMAAHASEKEGEATRAERDSIKFKQVEYLANQVGNTFDAVVTGVTDWGIYVSETGSQAEGLIRLSNMTGDYYEHESSKYRIKGQNTGKTFSLGDEIKVKLTRADTEERQLDFVLAPEETAS